MSERPAIIGGWLYVPVEAAGDLAALRRRLTFVPRKGPDVEPVPIHMWSDKKAGYIGVPREFGLAEFRHLPMENRTVLGGSIEVPRLPDPHHPRVRNPQAQAQFMADLGRQFTLNTSYVAMAPTGSGKTVCALNTAANLGRRTLILVHLERLMHQWIEEIEDKLGVPRNRIGIIQQDSCEWRDKDFSVGLLHSVVRRQYEPEFYTAYGTVIYDEVHKVGSQFFAPAVSLFPSKYRLGLSATPNRTDGGDKVFFWHLGPIRVTSEAEALPIKVYPVIYKTHQKLWGTTHGSRVKCLSLDDNRNRLLATLIKRFYDGNRQALFVGESIDHLQKLMTMAERAGVPRNAMGQYTAEIHRPVPDKKNPGKFKMGKVKQSKEALDDIKANSRLIFATYGMVTEGIDIPRLDGGMDVTPRSKATQLIGRVRRPVPGKREPIWLTLRDIGCSTSERYYKSRCSDYRSSGAEIVQHGQKETSA